MSTLLNTILNESRIVLEMILTQTSFNLQKYYQVKLPFI